MRLGALLISALWASLVVGSPVSTSAEAAFEQGLKAAEKRCPAIPNASGSARSRLKARSFPGMDGVLIKWLRSSDEVGEAWSHGYMIYQCICDKARKHGPFSDKQWPRMKEKFFAECLIKLGLPPTAWKFWEEKGKHEFRAEDNGNGNGNNNKMSFSLGSVRESWDRAMGGVVKSLNTALGSPRGTVVTPHRATVPLPRLLAVS